MASLLPRPHLTNAIPQQPQGLLTRMACHCTVAWVKTDTSAAPHNFKHHKDVQQQLALDGGLATLTNYIMMACCFSVA
jgi:hypothetical protein